MVSTIKPPITAIQRGIGTGMGKINTRNRGINTASTPPRAKTAPEAPIAMSEDDAKGVSAIRRKKILPSIPPLK